MFSQFSKKGSLGGVEKGAKIVFLRSKAFRKKKPKVKLLRKKVRLTEEVSAKKKQKIS
jgi:hypothetical protein